MEIERISLIGYYLKWYYPDEPAIGSKEVFYAPCNLLYSSIKMIELDDNRIVTKGGLYREDSLRKYENKVGAKVYIPFVNNISKVISKYRSNRSIKEFFTNIHNLALINFHPRRENIHSIQDIIDYHRLVIKSTPIHRTRFVILDIRMVNLEQEGHYVYVL